MKCHYEVLGLQRNSTNEQIKRAYRDLALKSHPDKNLDNSTESHSEFILIQQAYHVLIDPQERAWYDKHRESILKGGIGDNYKDDSLDVFPYFNASCYKGYGDDKQGFYGIYSHVFSTIYSEDLPFIDPKEAESSDDSDSDILEPAPTFGSSTSSYEEVVHPFYAYWQSYCTKKTYVWLDKHDIREAENRRVLRLMEKENKKVRDSARRERNEEIRHLVAFVRKRDKRVQAHKKLVEERAAEIQRKTEERRKKERQERVKKLEEYKASQAHLSGCGADAAAALESELRSLERMYGGGSSSCSSVGSGDSEDEEDDLHVDYDGLHCIACNKVFRSEAAFRNHEGSSRHRENLAALRSELLEEELQDLSLLSHDPPGGASGDSEPPSDQHSDPSPPPTAQPEPAAGNERKKLSKRQKKQRRQLQQQLVKGDSDSGRLEVGETEQENGAVDCDRLQEGNVEESRQSEDQNHQPPSTTLNVALSQTDKLAPQPENKKKSKKKTGTATNKDKSDPALREGESLAECGAPKPSTCDACEQRFSSRGKLFQHLKVTGHATVRSDRATDTGGGGGKRGKRKPPAAGKR